METKAGTKHIHAKNKAQNISYEVNWILELFSENMDSLLLKIFLKILRFKD